MWLVVMFVIQQIIKLTACEFGKFDFVLKERSYWQTPGRKVTVPIRGS